MGEKFVGSIALIPDDAAAPQAWLALREPESDSDRLIASERLEGESYRESLARELAWLFDVERGKHLLISAAPRLHLNFPTTLPGEEEPIFFVVEFYLVTLFGQRIRETIADRDDLIWLSTEELKAGVSSDGRPLDEGQRRLLCHGDVLPHPSGHRD